MSRVDVGVAVATIADRLDRVVADRHARFVKHALQRGARPDVVDGFRLAAAADWQAERGDILDRLSIWLQTFDATVH